MPTVLRVGAFRFFFYSNEGREPPHIHVQRAEALAKYWLRPIGLAASTGFRAHELRRLATLVREHENEFVEAWNGFFAT